MNQRQYQYYSEQRFEFSRPRVTWAVQRLILANVAVFAAQLLVHIPFGSMFGGYLTPPGGEVIGWLAFDPAAFLAGWVWTPLTYMFLHAGLLHLLFNMVWLYFFGPEVERVLSTRQFLRFYVLTGVLAALGPLLVYLAGRGEAPVVGASGAVMAVLVAFAVLNPEREIFLFPLPMPIHARWLVIIVIIMNLVNGLQAGAVSVSTHFAGMAAGFAYLEVVRNARRWWAKLERPPEAKKRPEDPIGEAVDNIFKFEEEKRRRK